MQQRLSRDNGFTLVELMVVVLIIAILIAIAIPTFLGARVRAQDRAAQSNLRNALTAAKVYYADGDTQDFGFALADIEAVHANLPFAAGNAPASGEVGFITLDSTGGDTDQAVVFIAQSASGTWFCILDEAVAPRSGTFYGEAAPPGTGADLDSLAECDGGWN